MQEIRTPRSLRYWGSANNSLADNPFPLDAPQSLTRCPIVRVIQGEVHVMLFNIAFMSDIMHFLTTYYVYVLRIKPPSDGMCPTSLKPYG